MYMSQCHNAVVVNVVENDNSISAMVDARKVFVKHMILEIVNSLCTAFISAVFYYS